MEVTEKVERTIMVHRAWLAGLKPGDEVIVEGPAAHELHLDHVKSVSKTRCVVGGKSYQLKDGVQWGRGSSWSWTTIAQPNDRTRRLAKEKELRHRLLKRLRDTRWYELKTAALLRVEAALDAKE